MKYRFALLQVLILGAAMVIGAALPLGAQSQSGPSIVLVDGDRAGGSQRQPGLGGESRHDLFWSHAVDPQVAVVVEVSRRRQDLGAEPPGQPGQLARGAADDERR